MRHGGQILVDQLKARGVTRVFSVPGESFLAVLDGLYDSGIENVVCRHEGGAAMMAEAHAKLTGEPGVCFVTRGPGATNASAGVHVARQDSTPLILFVGQIARSDRDREAFQEIDYRAVFGPLAKWASEIDQTARIPEYVSRAFRLAVSGRPGPVVLALPEDVLADHADVPDLPPAEPRASTVAEADVVAVMAALEGAERPLLVVGGSQWSEQAAADLARFAEAQDLPVTTSFRRQDRLDNRHSHYAGYLGVGMNPKLGARLGEADLLIVLGSRLGDTATNGYTLLDPAAPGTRIVHIHPDPDELGHVWRPDVAVVAPAPAMIAALARQNAAPNPQRQGWMKALRADFEAWTQPKETPGAVKMEQVIGWLAETLPDDAILTNGAGNFAAFLHRYYRYRGFPTELAPTSGSMGYGFPAAISASLEHPGRTVVCVAGDGDIQMTLNEFSTAMQHGATPITIVANNGQYGTIRMHQERTYPGRVSGTRLASPDFAALARAYGGHGERVERTEDFAAAFDRAVASGKPAMIELVLDPEALSAGATLSQTRAQGEAAAQKD
ncbi:thiamine pyrophosphate-binding protein [Haematobacter massiliensis]|uniref:Thiamine pyrophosphate-binding protein n=1 Tax=Haematobacter massiliensis TaxID=195105 RepID=A0A086YB50_9RHOB|nr:thiamine pyrophosphate-binding protein [Haematobacter massiliensis]KFI31500.1 thiamine pyrophosphate-binding protein [Haematobacter massiliensis]OWJ71605.1 thiamine pyrophosphate-binding protein [Haematobacter massiliensis]OWJ88042.1 thiamine pyrophosphate-binding protein [Haematobacter massiliensis]QBJ23577.1 thiamine pyrophosphate-binding protein [Haematobacter massiliensis]